jgi:outer membrane receptor for ferrienterochelin and colicins
MKPFLLLLIFFLHTHDIYATNPARIQIDVKDESSRQPIAGATIHFAGKHLISDENGRIMIESESKTKGSITAVGYQDAIANIDPLFPVITVFMVQMDNQLDNVVVSGSLRPMSKLASPIPVESYNARYFKTNPTPSLFDAVGMINGVQNQVTCNVCNTGEIRINGLDGPYTMVLIDGMPIVSSLSTVYGLSGIPNSMVKRIEVVKGPASTLYGSEAVAGIINIITVDPLTAHKLSGDINLSSIGELNTDLSTKFNVGKATSLLGLNYFNYTQPRDINNDNFTDVALQKRLSLFNKWSFDRRNNLPASLAIRLLTENRWGGEMQWTPAFKGSDSLYGESIDTRRVELLSQYGISKNLISEFSYNYHFQDSYYGKTWYRASQHTAFGQLRWSKEKGKHHWLAGVPMRLIQYDDNTAATEKESGVNAPSLQSMVGAFAQNEYNFSDKFMMLTGLRYEYTNVQGSVLAPRLAIKWQPASNQTLRLSAGNGFRVVNLFTEDHAALSGFREVEIKNELKPERSWNTNINYAAQVNTKNGIINVDVSGFYTWFTNRIVPDYDTDPQKIIYDNLDGLAISRGASTNIDWVSKKGIRAGIGATFMDVFVQEPDDAGQMQKQAQVYAPKWSGNYSLSVPIKKWKTNFDLTGTFSGPMRLPVFPHDLRPEYSPFYTLLNLQATHKFSHKFEVYLSAKNLLNFIPKNPILHPDDPFDRPGGKYWQHDGSPNQVTNPNGFTFDPSYNYAPMQGLRVLIGVRFSLH